MIRVHIRRVRLKRTGEWKWGAFLRPDSPRPFIMAAEVRELSANLVRWYVRFGNERVK